MGVFVPLWSEESLEHGQCKMYVYLSWQFDNSDRKKYHRIRHLNTFHPEVIYVVLLLELSRQKVELNNS